MTPDIRPAVAGDAAVLGRIHVRAWQAAYRGVMPDEYLDGLDPEERTAMWTQFIDRAPEDQRLEVVTVGDVVAGFACFGRCRDAGCAHLGELFAINLDPDAWGGGLGRTLLTAVTADLRAFGDEAVLWVVPGNARARALYESNGWSDDGGRRWDEDLGVRVDEMRYRVGLRASPAGAGSADHAGPSPGA